MVAQDQKPLLTRAVLVAALPDEGLEVTVEPTEAERAALAKADGLVELPALQGHFTLRRDRAGQGIAVRGEVVATLVQTCTVSLDPFQTDIREPVDLLYVSESRAAEWAKQREANGSDEEAEDPPDVIVDGRIDLGAVTAEFLALGIDPYPRKPGVAFDAGAYGRDADPSPFAALAKLKTDT